MKKYLFLLLALGPNFAFACGASIELLVTSNVAYFFLSVTLLLVGIIIFKGIKYKRFYKGKLTWVAAVTFIVFIVSLIISFNLAANANVEYEKCIEQCEEGKSCFCDSLC